MPKHNDKTGRGRRGLTYTLTKAFLWLSMIVLIFVTALDLFVSFTAQQDLVFKQQELIAENAANNVKSFIRDKFEILNTAVRIGNLADLEGESEKLIVEKLMGLYPSFRQLILLDEDGYEKHRVSRVSNLLSIQSKSELIEEAFEKTKDTDRYFSPIYIDETTSEPMAILAVPVRNVFSDFKGALIAEVNLKFMWDLVDRIKVGKKGLAYVVNREGALIAAGDISRVLKGENLSHLREVSDFLNNVNEKEEKPHLSEGLKGPRVVASHAALGLPDWAVVVELPVEEAYASLILKLKLSGLFLLLLCGGTVISGIFLARKITGPIIRLRDASREISKGRLDTYIAVESRNEIGELAESFNQMVKDLNQTTVSKEYLETILESAMNALFITQPDGTIEYANRSFEQMTGFTAAEIIGKKPSILKSGKHDRPFYQELWETIGKGEVFHREITNRKKNGALFIADELISSIKDSSGKIIKYIGVMHDITQRKHDEEELRKAYKDLERTQMQLVQSEKLASLGQLAAGVAHEINNPVGFISSNLETLEQYISVYSQLLKSMDLLKEAVAGNDPAKIGSAVKAIDTLKENENVDFITGDIDDLVTESRNGIERIRKIVLDLKTFARRGDENMMPNSIEEIIDGAINIVANEIKYHIDLKKEYGNVPLILCNSQKLGQVFINLFVNAAQAIEDKGKITVRTFTENDHIVVQIADTGKGIAKEYLDKVFDPFFTTKDIGKGTGLGLSVSYDLIKQNGGEIKVESEPGQGTVFTLTFPLNKETARLRRDG